MAPRPDEYGACSPFPAVVGFITGIRSAELESLPVILICNARRGNLQLREGGDRQCRARMVGSRRTQTKPLGLGTQRSAWAFSYALLLTVFGYPGTRRRFKAMNIHNGQQMIFRLPDNGSGASTLAGIPKSLLHYCNSPTHERLAEVL
eukprot:1061390-Rhodomonas_salina.1